MIRYLSSAMLAALVLATPLKGVAGPTFDAVKARGHVVCGVHSPGLEGFSARDGKGVWRGLDVDVCRAVAAAVFADASKVVFEPLEAQDRIAALVGGRIDILARNTTWTLGRDTADGARFTVTTFYDGQGFLVPRQSGLTGARQLDGKRICVQEGTTSAANLASYFRAAGLTYTAVAADGFDATVASFLDGRCDALTSDRSQLAVIRATRTKTPEDYEILPQVISKEPLAPAVRQGDDAWFGIVRWVLFVTIAAEEFGATSQNIAALRDTTDPDLRRILGIEPGIGAALGLSDRWAYNVIRQVGNYGEIFERNLGTGSRLNLLRGLNSLWIRDGLMYAPPLR